MKWVENHKISVQIPKEAKTQMVGDNKYHIELVEVRATDRYTTVITRKEKNKDLKVELIKGK